MKAGDHLSLASSSGIGVDALLGFRQALYQLVQAFILRAVQLLHNRAVHTTCSEASSVERTFAHLDRQQSRTLLGGLGFPAREARSFPVHGLGRKRVCSRGFCRDLTRDSQVLEKGDALLSTSSQGHCGYVCSSHGQYNHLNKRDTSSHHGCNACLSAPMHGVSDWESSALALQGAADASWHAVPVLLLRSHVAASLMTRRIQPGASWAVMASLSTLLMRISIASFWAFTCSPATHTRAQCLATVLAHCIVHVIARGGGSQPLVTAATCLTVAPHAHSVLENGHPCVSRVAAQHDIMVEPIALTKSM